MASSRVTRKDSIEPDIEPTDVEVDVTPRDVAKVRAELQNGTLSVTAPLAADARSQRVAANTSPPRPGAVGSALPHGWPAPSRWR